MTVVGDNVVQEIRIEATPDQVFPYFTEPELMMRWMGTDAKLDAQPGGVFRVNVNGKDVAVGEYVVVDAPTRVRFSWGWEGNDGVPPGSSSVEVTLTADGGATVVRLVHSGLPVPTLAQHDDGWSHFAARLAVAGTGTDPGPDPWVAAG